MDDLRIVKGNTFATVVQIKAYQYNGEEMADFDLRQCTDIAIIAHINLSTNNYINVSNRWIYITNPHFEVLDEENLSITWPAEDQQLGLYLLEISGKFNGIAWRFYDKKAEFRIVNSNAESYLPKWAIIKPDEYRIRRHSMYISNAVYAIGPESLEAEKVARQQADQAEAETRQEADTAIQNELTAHKNDDSLHVSTSDRTYWNSKQNTIVVILDDDILHLFEPDNSDNN